MDSTVFDFVWREIVRRQYASAAAIDKNRYPEIHRKALNEVSTFDQLPSPDSGHQLNLRRVCAYSMMMNWESEINRSLRPNSN